MDLLVGLPVAAYADRVVGHAEAGSVLLYDNASEHLRFLQVDRAMLGEFDVLGLPERPDH